MNVAIIICTYNRATILQRCLDNLIHLTSGSVALEIIVVDNNSSDTTATIIEAATRENPKIKYHIEEQIGLSYARNRGAAMAKGEWLIFLDDDALLDARSFVEIVKTIDNYPFLLFTGIWKEWHLQIPPVWLPHSTGNYILKGTKEVREIGNDYITGLIMIINRQKLLDIGGFPTHLGMTGDKVAYGEESWVENEFKKRGWAVGINPNIVIEHLVGEHKYKLNWHLRAAYAKGRDTYAIDGGSKVLVGLRLAKSMLIGWLKPIVKLVVRKEYYLQNVLIDYVGSILYYWGAFWSSTR